MAAKATKVSTPDYSTWTIQELGPDGKPIQAAVANPTPSQAVATTITQDVGGAPKAQLVAAPPPLPDITTQDPNTFASLTANLARAGMANPTVDDFNKVFQDALGKGQEYWRTRQEKLDEAQIEQTKAQNLQKSAALVDIEKSKQMVPIEVAKSVATTAAQMPLEQEKAQLAEGMTPAQAQEQWIQGQTARGLTTQQAQAAWDASAKAGATPTIKALPDAEADKAAQVVNGYKALTDLHTAYNQMHANAPSGVVFGSIGGVVSQFSSPQQIAYNSLVDDTMAPIARSMGDTGAGLTKDVIMNQIRQSLPVIQDSDAVAGQKIFLRKQQYLNQLQTQRDMLVGRYNVSALDTQIAKMNSELGQNGTLSKYNPLTTSPVSGGLSTTANANLNAKIAPTPSQAVAAQNSNPQPQPAQPNQPAQPTQQQLQQTTQQAQQFPNLTLAMP